MPPKGRLCWCAAALLASCGGAAAQGAGQVLFIKSDGVFRMDIDGQNVLQVATYTCYDCAGLATTTIDPTGAKTRYVYWTDSNTARTETAVYRAPVEPAGGTPATPEKVCSLPGSSTSAGGLTCDDGSDGSGGYREPNVYFSNYIERSARYRWLVSRCAANTLGASADAWQSPLVDRDWGGGLAFSAKHRTVYLSSAESRGSDPNLMFYSVDASPFASSNVLMASKFSSLAQNIGVVTVSDADSSLYYQTAECMTCAGTIYKMSADPANPGTAQEFYQATPAWLAFEGRPRALLGQSANPQPPNVAAVGDAPGYLVWADGTAGAVYLKDVVGGGAAQEIYKDPAGAPAGGSMGVGPVAWLEVERVPTASPTKAPNAGPTKPPVAPSAVPSAAPQAAAAPSQSPAVPPTAAPAATAAAPTISPAAGPPAPSASPAAGPPVPSASPKAVPTQSPAAAAAPPPTAGPKAAAPTGTAPPQAAAKAAPPDDGDDSGFLAGLFAGLAAGLLVSVVVTVCYIRKLRKKVNAPPQEKEPEPVRQMPDAEPLIAPLSPEPSPRLRPLPALPSGTYRIVAPGGAEVSPACMLTSEVTRVLAEGDTVVVRDVIVSDNRVRARLQGGGYITLADAREDADAAQLLEESPSAPVHVSPVRPVSSTRLSSLGTVALKEVAPEESPSEPSDGEAHTPDRGSARHPAGTTPLTPGLANASMADSPKRSSRRSRQFSNPSPLGSRASWRSAASAKPRSGNESFARPQSPRAQWETARGLRLPSSADAPRRMRYPLSPQGSGKL
eukprot:TRINITY_DN15231_c1_g2_i1.p1 TRINITY_DN15231_c1_g2~~TRINITY_DN15231_c1_g2_i1.p1  ORF type:complete len:786 (+),score=171.22 TRINITY_DN15231_c1_g2_i1:62-2419(+)